MLVSGDWHYLRDWLDALPPLQQTLKELERVYTGFFPKHADVPRFKRISRSRDSFRYPDPKPIKLDKANRRLFPPKLGWLRYRKCCDVLGTVKDITVTQSGSKWSVSIQTEREAEIPVHQGGAVGITMGNLRFTTRSDGAVFEPLSSFKRREQALAKVQHAMSRKTPFGENWPKAKAKVQRIHTKIGNSRRNALRKTTTGIDRIAEIPSWVYLISFAVLPAFGVPILAYYLTIGVVIDGLGWTLLAAWTCMAANMAFSYVLARGLHGPLNGLATRRGYRIPCLRPGDEWKVILMVRASPLPWMMQNYLLTLGGARFRPYLLVGIPVQALIGLGVILLGDAILSGDLRWAPIGLFLVAAVWVALRVIRMRSVSAPPLRASPQAIAGDRPTPRQGGAASFTRV